MFVTRSSRPLRQILGHFAAILLLATSLAGCYAPLRSPGIPARALSAEFRTPSRKIGDPLNFATLVATPIQEYTLGRGDMVSVTVADLIQRWDARPFELQVLDSGEIHLPRVGPIRVQGMTLPQAQDEVNRRLADGFLKNPAAVITLQKKGTVEIVVLGAVRSPGIQSLVRFENDVAHALAAAGGLSEEAGDFIEIHRRISPQGPLPDPNYGTSWPPQQHPGFGIPQNRFGAPCCQVPVVPQNYLPKPGDMSNGAPLAREVTQLPGALPLERIPDRPTRTAVPQQVTGFPLTGQTDGRPFATAEQQQTYATIDEQQFQQQQLQLQQQQQLQRQFQQQQMQQQQQSLLNDGNSWSVPTLGGPGGQRYVPEGLTQRPQGYSLEGVAVRGDGQNDDGQFSNDASAGSMPAANPTFGPMPAIVAPGGMMHPYYGPPNGQAGPADSSRLYEQDPAVIENQMAMPNQHSAPGQFSATAPSQASGAYLPQTEFYPPNQAYAAPVQMAPAMGPENSLPVRPLPRVNSQELRSNPQTLPLPPDPRRSTRRNRPAAEDRQSSISPFSSILRAQSPDYVDSYPYATTPVSSPLTAGLASINSSATAQHGTWTGYHEQPGAILRIPLRGASVSPNDVVLFPGDVVVVPPRKHEVFYVVGRLNQTNQLRFNSGVQDREFGAGLLIPRDRDIDVVTAVTMAGYIDPINSPTTVTVHRVGPDGFPILIKVDLIAARFDPAETVYVQGGDIIYLNPDAWWYGRHMIDRVLPNALSGGFGNALGIWLTR